MWSALDHSVRSGWGLQVAERLGLPELLARHLPQGKEKVAWWAVALILAIMRFAAPSSELAVAEGGYAATALPELLGVPAEKINDDRLYRAPDRLLPLKNALESHLFRRMGELFEPEYDLLLFDVTSTYFEGTASGNAQASRGYSRYHRPDCKQVCIALVVSHKGLPLGYEVFDGNRTDVTTVQQVVLTMKPRYGRADRIWVMDREMLSEANVQFLGEEGRRYILGAPKQQLRRFKRELLGEDWQSVRDGLEVKLCPGPDGEELFILCRSADRREKERAIYARFEARIENRLQGLQQVCEGRRPPTAGELERRVGRLLGANFRAAGLFAVTVGTDAERRTSLTWRKRPQRREWAELGEGCYLLCFLAYAPWKTMGQLCRRAGLRDCPRQVIQERSRIRMVDVILPTDRKVELRRRSVTPPRRSTRRSSCSG